MLMLFGYLRQRDGEGMLNDTPLLPEDYKLSDDEVSTRDDGFVAYMSAPGHGSGLIQLHPKGAIPRRRSSGSVDFEWVYGQRDVLYFYFKIWAVLKHEFKPYSHMVGEVKRLKKSLRERVTWATE